MDKENGTLQSIQESEDIRNKIYTIRGIQVMLDRDIAELYHVETRIINQSVKRNPERFPVAYCFQLSNDEFDEWKSQIVMTNSEKMSLRRKPFAFSERGIAMLSTVLHSQTAIEISMKIMDAFVAMRHYLADNALVFQRLDRIETKQLEADKKFEVIFNKLEEPREKKAVLFFQGQLYDAFSCIADIIHKAKSDIILIDGYVATATLDLLSKKRKAVAVEIYTSQSNCKLTASEITDFNKQYGDLSVKYTSEFHDRFLILDKKELYLIGSSIKDAGKKAFEISRIEDEQHIQAILKRLYSVAVIQ